VGFARVQRMGVPHNQAKGFQREILIFFKGRGGCDAGGDNKETTGEESGRMIKLNLLCSINQITLSDSAGAGGKGEEDAADKR
jgi:hypothetical protein